MRLGFEEVKKEFITPCGPTGPTGPTGPKAEGLYNRSSDWGGTNVSWLLRDKTSSTTINDFLHLFKNQFLLGGPAGTNFWVEFICWSLTQRGSSPNSQTFSTVPPDSRTVTRLCSLAALRAQNTCTISWPLFNKNQERGGDKRRWRWREGLLSAAGSASLLCLLSNLSEPCGS